MASGTASQVRSIHVESSVVGAFFVILRKAKRTSTWMLGKLAEIAGVVSSPSVSLSEKSLVPTSVATNTVSSSAMRAFSLAFVTLCVSTTVR